MELDRDADGRSGALDESERQELARLREQREKERAELEMERDILKRSVVLWVKDPMNR